ncbi:hypothetical protein RSAG8_09230, partial [Rhizoctonia solani AG-8 WAC10335]
MSCERINHTLARQLRRAISSPLGGGLYKDGAHKDIATWAAMDGSQNWGTINPMELQQWAPIDESPLWDMKTLSDPNKGSWEEAIKQCDSFMRSQEYVKALDPTAILDYIPMRERVKHAKDIGKWHLEKSDNEDDGWLIDMTSIGPWVDRQVQAWKDQVPEGMGRYVDDYSPEDVYQMILEWKLGISDLYDWLKWRESKLPEWELGSSMAELILKED